MILLIKIYHIRNLKNYHGIILQCCGLLFSCSKTILTICSLCKGEIRLLFLCWWVVGTVTNCHHPTTALSDAAQGNAVIWKANCPLAFQSTVMAHYKGVQTVVLIWANKYVYPPNTSNSGMPFSSWGFFLFYFSLCIKMTSGNWELIKLPFYACLYSSLISFILRIIYPKSNFCIQIMLFC